MKRKLAIGCLTPVLIGLLAAGIFAYRQHRYVERVYARAQAMGVPTTYAELEARYPMPPEGENAADLYRQAFEIMAPIHDGWDKATRDMYFDNLIYGTVANPMPTPWAADAEALTRAYCREHGEVTPLALAGTMRNQCRFIKHFTPGALMALEHLYPARMLGELFVLEACIAAIDGDSARVLVMMEAVSKISRHIQSEPCIISQMMSAALWRKGANTAESIISMNVLDAEETAKIVMLFQSDITSANLTHGLLAEVVLYAEYGRLAQFSLNETWLIRVQQRIGAERYTAIMRPFDTLVAAHGIEAMLDFIDAVEKDDTIPLQELDALAAYYGDKFVVPAASGLVNLTRAYIRREDASARLAESAKERDAAP